MGWGGGVGQEEKVKPKRNKVVLTAVLLDEIEMGADVEDEDCDPLPDGCPCQTQNIT